MKFLTLLLFLIGCTDDASIIRQAKAKIKHETEVEHLCKKYGKILNEDIHVDHEEVNSECVFLQSGYFFGLRDLKIIDFTYKRLEELESE